MIPCEKGNFSKFLNGQNLQLCNKFHESLMSFSLKLSFESKVLVKLTFMIILYVHCNYRNSFRLIVVLIHSQNYQITSLVL